MVLIQSKNYLPLNASWACPEDSLSIILEKNPSHLGEEFSLICCSLFAKRAVHKKSVKRSAYGVDEQLNFSRLRGGIKTPARMTCRAGIGL